MKCPLQTKAFKLVYKRIESEQSYYICTTLDDLYEEGKIQKQVWETCKATVQQLLGGEYTYLGWLKHKHPEVYEPIKYSITTEMFVANKLNWLNYLITTNDI